MNASATIRSAGRDDSTAIERLATDLECVRWGGLGSLTAQLLIDRWQESKITRSFIQVVKTAGNLQGYSDIYQVSPTLARFHGVAINVDAACSLIDWTSARTEAEVMSLQTSLSSVEEGRKLFQNTVEHPLYSLLVERGFSAFSTTRAMRFVPKSESELPAFPQSYRLIPYDASLLPLLMATYYVAWPKDYYQNEDRSGIEDIFREAHSDDLRLVMSSDGDVVGYALLSRTPEQGVIDEVAVHPAHRRKGLGEALTRWAIRDLGDRTITLVVMDDNPARYLYEKLGFVVWEERLDLILPRR